MILWSVEHTAALFGRSDGPPLWNFSVRSTINDHSDDSSNFQFPTATFNATKTTTKQPICYRRAICWFSLPTAELNSKPQQ